MDLSVVPGGRYVCVKISVLVVLFYIVAKPSGNGVARPLELTIGQWKVRSCKNILNPQVLTDVLENLGIELFAIILQAFVANHGSQHDRLQMLLSHTRP